MSADDGYFPRATSTLRRVHEERAVGLFYGQRALCIGALAPLNYVGTSEHTRHKRTPFKRLAHTGAWFEVVMFGSKAEADRVLDAVHRMHELVRGELPEDAGPHHPAGTLYDAFDPELMLWTVALMMDSAEVMHDLLVRPLTDVEREGLWQDYRRFATLFGLDPGYAPVDYPAFRAYFDRRLAADDMWLTDEARIVGHFSAFEIPMPRRAQVSKKVHDLIMRGALPPRVRAAYDLSWTPLHAAGFAAAVTAFRRGRVLLPGAALRGSSKRFFDNVARTEAWRLERGRPTPQVPVGPVADAAPRGAARV